jgi:hypothetical protein
LDIRQKMTSSKSFIWALFICVCLIFKSNASISYRDIQWKLASSTHLSHYDTCTSSTLLPYNPSPNDFIWNSTVLQYVVETVLLNTIHPSSFEGLSGCCSSSLWCVSGVGCFTQNFGGSFVNYGWMRNNTNNVPVYACISSSAALGSLTLDYVTVDGIQTNSPVFAVGDGASEANADFLTQINGFYCPYGDVCQTFHCSNDYDCPLGMGCFNVSGYDTNLCYQYCANSNDTSCPCGQQCILSEGSASTALYVCASDDLQGGLPLSNTLTTCSPLGGLLSELPIGQSAVVSSASELQGVRTVAASLAVLACTQDSTCIDYNPCTKDMCIQGTCHHIPYDNQCQSESSTLLEQTASYTYLTTTTTSVSPSSLVPSFTSLYEELNFAKLKSHVGLSIVTIDFTWSYFGNIVQNFVVDVNGVLSWAPYYGCDNEQCMYFTSSTNSISIGYDLNRSESLAYSAFKVQWTDESNTIGRIGAVHILFLAPASATGANTKPSTIVSIFQDGSIRMTYNTTVAINTDSSTPLENIVTTGSSSMLPFTGLWGAHAGKNYLYPGNASSPTLSSSQLQFASSSTSRFHVSNASFILSSSGGSSSNAASPGTTQVLSFCPFELSVCAPSSCVSPGASLALRWNGTNTCHALAQESSQTNLSFACNWMGGLFTTEAVYDNIMVDGYRQLSCPVPTISNAVLSSYGNVSNSSISQDGILLTVNIVPTIAGRVVDESVQADGDKSTRAIYYDPNSGELARGSLLVRYYPSVGNVPATCGCRPFTSSSMIDASLSCAVDSNICGGEELYGNVSVASSAVSSLLSGWHVKDEPGLSSQAFANDFVVASNDESLQQHTFKNKIGQKPGSLPHLYPPRTLAGNNKQGEASIEPRSSVVERMKVLSSVPSSLISRSFQALSSSTGATSTAATAYIFDCANTAFGSAYIDSCGVCSGGVTRRTPISSTSAANGYCTSSNSGGGGGSGTTLTIITQTIILLLVICCLTFLTSAVTFSIRRMLLRRQTEQFLLENELALQQMMMNANGELNQVGRILSMRSTPLTEFERDALGEVVFSPEFANSLMRKGDPLVKNSTSTPTIVLPPTNSANNMSANALECPICLVEFSEGDIVRHLPDPCGHVFHRDCIDHWFRQSSQCPLCKRSLRSILTGTYDEQEHRRRHQQSQQLAESQENSSLPPPSPTVIISNASNSYAALPQQATAHQSRREPNHDSYTDDLSGISLRVFPQGTVATTAPSPTPPPARPHSHHHHHRDGSQHRRHHHQNRPHSLPPDGQLSSSQHQRRQQQVTVYGGEETMEPRAEVIIAAANTDANHGIGVPRAYLSPEDRLRLEAARLSQQQQQQGHSPPTTGSTNNNNADINHSSARRYNA